MADASAPIARRQPETPRVFMGSRRGEKRTAAEGAEHATSEVRLTGGSSARGEADPRRSSSALLQVLHKREREQTHETRLGEHQQRCET